MATEPPRKPEKIDSDDESARNSPRSSPQKDIEVKTFNDYAFEKENFEKEKQRRNKTRLEEEKKIIDLTKNDGDELPTDNSPTYKRDGDAPLTGLYPTTPPSPFYVATGEESTKYQISPSISNKPYLLPVPNNATNSGRTSDITPPQKTGENFPLRPFIVLGPSGMYFLTGFGMQIWLISDVHSIDNIIYRPFDEPPGKPSLLLHSAHAIEVMLWEASKRFKGTHKEHVNVYIEVHEKNIIFQGREAIADEHDPNRKIQKQQNQPINNLIPVKGFVIYDGTLKPCPLICTFLFFEKESKTYEKETSEDHLLAESSRLFLKSTNRNQPLHQHENSYYSYKKSLHSIIPSDQRFDLLDFFEKSLVRDFYALLSAINQNILTRLSKTDVDNFVFASADEQSLFDVNEMFRSEAFMSEPRFHRYTLPNFLPGQSQTIPLAKKIADQHFRNLFNYIFFPKETVFKNNGDNDSDVEEEVLSYETRGGLKAIAKVQSDYYKNGKIDQLPSYQILKVFDDPNDVNSYRKINLLNYLAIRFQDVLQQRVRGSENKSADEMWGMATSALMDRYTALEIPDNLLARLSIAQKQCREDAYIEYKLFWKIICQIRVQVDKEIYEKILGHSQVGGGNDSRLSKTMLDLIHELEEVSAFPRMADYFLIPQILRDMFKNPTGKAVVYFGSSHIRYLYQIFCGVGMEEKNCAEPDTSGKTNQKGSSISEQKSVALCLSNNQWWIDDYPSDFSDKIPTVRNFRDPFFIFYLAAVDEEYFPTTGMLEDRNSYSWSKTSNLVLKINGEGEAFDLLFPESKFGLIYREYYGTNDQNVKTENRFRKRPKRDYFKPPMAPEKPSEVFQQKSTFVTNNAAKQLSKKRRQAPSQSPSKKGTESPKHKKLKLDSDDSSGSEDDDTAKLIFRPPEERLNSQNLISPVAEKQSEKKNQDSDDDDDDDEDDDDEEEKEEESSQSSEEY